MMSFNTDVDQIVNFYHDFISLSKTEIDFQFYFFMTRKIHNDPIISYDF